MFIFIAAFFYVLPITSMRTRTTEKLPQTRQDKLTEVKLKQDGVPFAVCLNIAQILVHFVQIYAS